MSTVSAGADFPEEDAAETLQPPLVSQEQLDFGIMVQGSHKTLQEVISNPSRQPMIWLADTSDNGWLLVEPDNGVLQPGEQQMIQVTFDSRHLAIGEYTFSLRLTSEGDNLSMSTEITGTGSVNLTPPAVALHFGSLAPHSSRTLGLVINPSDSGAGKETWNAEIVYSNGAKGWLELDHTSGVFDVEARMIHVTANATNMLSQQEGDEPLTAKIIFTSAANGTASASTEIPVSVYINEIPFHDGGPKCPPPPPPHLKRTAQGAVENSSTGPFVSNPASYNNGTVKWWIDPPKVNWLTAQPSSGTLKPGESGQVTWQVKAGLSSSANPYKTDIMLNVGYDSPQKTNIAQFPVSVVLTV